MAKSWHHDRKCGDGEGRLLFGRCLGHAAVPAFLEDTPSTTLRFLNIYQPRWTLSSAYSLTVYAISETSLSMKLTLPLLAFLAFLVCDVPQANPAVILHPAI
jgi:hypothetical protein